MSKTLGDYIGEYSSKTPYDFTDNPNKIKYVDPQKMHSKTDGVCGASDISLHFPLLTFLAYQVDHIVELGCRDGESTIALLMGEPRSLISVDINPTVLTQDLHHLPNWRFILQSSVSKDLAIGEPDMLLVDSDHSYEHVKRELDMHANKVQRWIVLHDSQSISDVTKAIDEFIENNKNVWHLVYNLPFNHGLIVLQRVE